MNFEIGKYRVVVREGNSQSKIEVSFHHHPGLTSVFVDAPTDLLHPVFRGMFERKIKDITDEVQRRYNTLEVSNYITNRKRNVVWKATQFRKEFVSLHGDIEEAKDAWDYNRAPKGVVTTGKFGDLKAFLEMRTGRELNVVSENE